MLCKKCKKKLEEKLELFFSGFSHLQGLVTVEYHPNACMRKIKSLAKGCALYDAHSILININRTKAIKNSIGRAFRLPQDHYLHMPKSFCYAL